MDGKIVNVYYYSIKIINKRWRLKGGQLPRKTRALHVVIVFFFLFCCCMSDSRFSLKHTMNTCVLRPVSWLSLVFFRSMYVIEPQRFIQFVPQLFYVIRNLSHFAVINIHRSETVFNFQRIVFLYMSIVHTDFTWNAWAGIKVQLYSVDMAWKNAVCARSALFEKKSSFVCILSKTVNKNW